MIRFCLAVVLLSQISSCGEIDQETQSQGAPAPVEDNGLLYESPRNRVVAQNGMIALIQRTGEEWVPQTVLRVDNPAHAELAYLEAVLGAISLYMPPRRVLLGGLGGGYMVHYFSQIDPQSAIHAVEIDPEVVGIAHAFFWADQYENVSVEQGDFLDYVTSCTSSYDAIIVDAPILTVNNARSFVSQLARCVSVEGIVVVNLGVSTADPGIKAAFSEAFLDAWLVALPQAPSNAVLVGCQVEGCLDERRCSDDWRAYRSQFGIDPARVCRWREVL